MDFLWEWELAMNKIFRTVILMKGKKYSRQNSPLGSDIWSILMCVWLTQKLTLLLRHRTWVGPVKALSNFIWGPMIAFWLAKSYLSSLLIVKENGHKYVDTSPREIQRAGAHPALSLSWLRAAASMLVKSLHAEVCRDSMAV